MKTLAQRGQQSPGNRCKGFGSISKMKADLLPKEWITSLGFQEDLYGIGVGGLEVGRDWS